ncbi:histidinol dehydrogenase [Candidatus Calescamantes bacterium]|nr:histidinol dehydrogenase [Candidatus Calescamantes bacterium]
MKVWKESIGLKKRNFFPLELEKKVREIVQEVRQKGDRALKEFTRRFDGVELNSFEIKKEEIEESSNLLREEEKYAIEELKKRIEDFSLQEKRSLTPYLCGGKNIQLGKIFVPLNRIGVYVPGGKVPLPSSLLMASIPARVAGVKEIVVTTPPQKTQRIHPSILYAAKISEVETIYTIGGAQAISALAFGTESISRVEKIVGPGNIYVTLAKRIVFGEVGVDMLAGPSEVMVIADEEMPKEWVKFDLLSQLEHGIDSLSILVTTSNTLASWIVEEMGQLEGDIKKAWERGGGVYEVENLEEAISLANDIAPEHLILGVNEAEIWLKKIKKAGTVFLGYLSPVCAGDFGVGVNHILPTGGSASFSSPLGVKDFMKEINTVHLNREGLEEITPLVETFSQLERLPFHGEEIKCRMEGEKK